MATDEELLGIHAPARSWQNKRNLAELSAGFGVSFTALAIKKQNSRAKVIGNTPYARMQTTVG